MQNGMCDPKGSHARLGLDIAPLATVVEPCRRLIAAARQGGVPVIYSRLAYAPDYSDGGFIVNELLPGIRSAQVCLAGSWDTEIVAALAPQPGDLVIDKTRMSSFIRTPLERHLRARGIDSLVVCGVTTNVCIESTVRDAAQLDFRPFVVTDAVGEVDPARHAAALTAMRWAFARLVSVDDVLADWR